MAARTGIGLTLAPHSASGALRVTALDADGPAAKGGLILIGDVLHEVDDTRCPPRVRAQSCARDFNGVGGRVCPDRVKAWHSHCIAAMRLSFCSNWDP